MDIKKAYYIYVISMSIKVVIAEIKQQNCCILLSCSWFKKRTKITRL